MAARFLEPEGVRDFGQRKGAVDHRVAGHSVDPAGQVQLMPAAADGGRSGRAGVGEVNQRQAVELLVRISLDSFHRRTGIRVVD